MAEKIEAYPEEPDKSGSTREDEAKFREGADRFRKVTAAGLADSVDQDDGADRHLEKEETLDDRMQAAAAREATSLHAKAVKAEPIVTRDLESVARGAGSALGGLDHRLKTKSSLKEKLTCDPFVGLQAARPEAAISSRGEVINDSLRYTVISTEERYMSARSAVHVDLRARGYELEKFSNAWVATDGSVAEPYRGINETWRTPQAYPFEIQFHTAASFDMKNSNHTLYEEWRKPDTGELRGQELAGIMSGRFDAVSVPPGALDGPRSSGPIERAAETHGDDSAEGTTK